MRALRGSAARVFATGNAADLDRPWPSHSGLPENYSAAISNSRKLAMSGRDGTPRTQTYLPLSVESRGRKCGWRPIAIATFQHFAEQPAGCLPLPIDPARRPVATISAGKRRRQTRSKKTISRAAADLELAQGLDRRLRAGIRRRGSAETWLRSGVARPAALPGFIQMPVKTSLTRSAGARALFDGLSSPIYVRLPVAENRRENPGHCARPFHTLAFGSQRVCAPDPFALGERSTSKSEVAPPARAPSHRHRWRPAHVRFDVLAPPPPTARVPQARPATAQPSGWGLPAQNAAPSYASPRAFSKRGFPKRLPVRSQERCESLYGGFVRRGAANGTAALEGTSRNRGC